MNAMESAGEIRAEALAQLQGWYPTLAMTATRCVCCGKRLADAVSVTRGIGPDCAKTHYKMPFDPSENQLADALGRLVASPLPTEVKRVARDIARKPREFANLLIWWAAVHLNDIDTVLACAEVLTMIGFTTLGARLRERNTNVSILKTNGKYVLGCLSQKVVLDLMKQVRDITHSTEKGGGRYKHTFAFTPERYDLVMRILGCSFGNEWASVTADDGATVLIKIDPANQWSVLREIRALYNPPAVRTSNTSNPVVNTPHITGTSVVRLGPNSVQVHTPTYSATFVAELKSLPTADRKWDADGRFWRVAPIHVEAVRRMVAAHFNGAV